MEALIAYLPALACAAMMLLVCIPMMRRMHGHHEQPGDADSRKEIAELREEIARLRAERALDSDEEDARG